MALNLQRPFSLDTRAGHSPAHSLTRSSSCRGSLPTPSPQRTRPPHSPLAAPSHSARPRSVGSRVAPGRTAASAPSQSASKTAAAEKPSRHPEGLRVELPLLGPRGPPGTEPDKRHETGGRDTPSQPPRPGGTSCHYVTEASRRATQPGPCSMRRDTTRAPSHVNQACPLGTGLLCTKPSQLCR